MKRTSIIAAGVLVGIIGLVAAALFGCVLAQYWHYVADKQNAELRLKEAKDSIQALARKQAKQEQDGERRLQEIEGTIKAQKASLASQAERFQIYTTLTNKEHEVSLSLKKLEAEILPKAAELTSLDKQIAILSLQIASSNAALTKASHELAAKYDELREYTLATNSLQTAHRAIALNQETIKTQTSQISALKTDIEKLNRDQAAIEKSIHEKQLAEEKSSEKANGLATQIALLEKQKKGLEEDLQKLEAKKTAFNQTLSSLTASMERARLQLSPLNTQIRETNATYAQLTNNLAKTRADIFQAQQTAQKEIAVRKADAQAEVDVFRKQREAEVFKLAELNANQTALTATIANLKKERKGLEDSIKELENAQDKLRASLAREETTLELAKKEVKEQQGLIERQEAILSDLNKKIEKKMAELEKSAQAL